MHNSTLLYVLYIASFVMPGNPRSILGDAEGIALAALALAAGLRYFDKKRTGEGLHMPTLSQFYGILIRMYWQDHSPPHFHALYGSDEALINIETLEIYAGKLPRRAKALVLEWAALHRKELMEAWRQCSSNQTPQPIAPLD